MKIINFKLKIVPYFRVSSNAPDFLNCNKFVEIAVPEASKPNGGRTSASGVYGAIEYSDPDSGPKHRIVNQRLKI